MRDSDYRSQIELELQQLGIVAQQKVLEFVRSLRNTPVASTSSSVDRVAEFAGSIPVEDLKAMKQAIEDGCETVDLNEW